MPSEHLQTGDDLFIDLAGICPKALVLGEQRLLDREGVGRPSH
jgi:hypothetical protein